MTTDLGTCVDFLQRLIRTPSLPGQEGEIAALVCAEMTQLGYDEVRTDEAGNTIGLVRGRGEAAAVNFNTHLDHVDVGDHDRWPHPPFGGELHDDVVWGRGAVDIKGPLAAQVHGIARLARAGHRPLGDVYVTAVVQEEIGGVGARHLLTHLPTPIVVVGEPSSNTLRRGHRGRSELIVHITGRSVHASVPGQGVNPFEVLAGFVAGLGDLEMASDPDLGTSTVAPTLIRTDQTSGNVVPGEIWLTCDWRQVPGETAEHARTKLDAVLQRCVIPGASAEVVVPLYHRTAYTGLKQDIPGDNPAYILASDHPAVRAASRVLAPVIGAMDEVDVWRFATDGGHYSQAGMACIGFGPGDELLAHTVNERIPVQQLETAMAANELLALSLAATAESM